MDSANHSRQEGGRWGLWLLMARALDLLFALLVGVGCVMVLAWPL